MPEVDLDRARKAFEGLSSAVVNPTPPAIGQAEENVGINWTQVINPADFYYKLVLSALYVMASLAGIVLIYGGILYLSSGGDAEKAERGKKTVIGAIIGIIVIAAAYSVYNFMIWALTRPVS